MLVIALVVVAAVPPVFGFAGGGQKVTVEEILQEVVVIRKELRELKVQRERDQRQIEELREMVERLQSTQQRPGPSSTTTGAGGSRAAASGELKGPRLAGEASGR